MNIDEGKPNYFYDSRADGDVKQQITQLESDEYPIPDFPEYINKIKEYIKDL